MSHLPPITAHSLEVQAAKTVVVFALVATGLRLLGKREASQLNVYDLAMLMALANAVQNAMTGGRGNLGVGLVTSSVVVLLAWGVTRLILRKPGIERLVIGSPTILVHQGRVQRRADGGDPRLRSLGSAAGADGGAGGRRVDQRHPLS